MDIAKKLKDARNAKGLTQQQLANMLGVTDRAISNWENGKRLPDYSLISDLCSILDININDLFDKDAKIIERYYKEKINKIIYSMNLILLLIFFLAIFNPSYIYFGIIGVLMIIYLYIMITSKKIKNYNKIDGIIVSFKKLYFVKINKKMFRTSIYKDSYFPLLVKIEYEVNNRKYFKNKIILKEIKPEKGMKISIMYDKNNPNSIKLL